MVTFWSHIACKMFNFINSKGIGSLSQVPCRDVEFVDETLTLVCSRFAEVWGTSEAYK